MTGPDNGEAVLEIQGERWVLRYPCGALVALQAAFGQPDGSVDDAARLVQDLKPSNVALFVWAGRLHEDRGLELDDVRKAIDWGETPILAVINAISDAWTLSLQGSLEPETVPGKERAESGSGLGYFNRLAELFRSRRENSGGDGLSPTAPQDPPPTPG